MLKDKRIQKIIIYILILSLMMFMSGFFVARKAYASLLVEDSEVIYPENYTNGYVIGCVPFIDANNYYVAYLCNLDPNDIEDYVGIHLEISTRDSEVETFHFGNYIYDGETYRVKKLSDYMHCKIYIYETLENATNSLFETDKTNVEGYKSDSGDIYVRYNGLYEDTIIDNILYSSADIYRNGILVFPKTPLRKNPTLVGITKTEMITGVMEQVVSMIPIAIGLMVSFLGFRKALALLRKILGQA